MKRALIAVLAGLCLATPASAQVFDGDSSGVMAGYVALFNRGDAAALAKDIYALPGVDLAATEATIKSEIEALRRDDLGRVDLYGFRSCLVSADLIRIEMRYGLLYAYGGLMPPGDQAKIFEVAKTPDGWRIRGEATAPFEREFTCAL
jgi:hypothetical protein